MRNGVRFRPHVHPECYDERDPLDWRRPLLHRRTDQCELQMCTWADHDEAGRDRYVELARQLSAELRPLSATQLAIVTVLQAHVFASWAEVLHEVRGPRRRFDDAFDALVEREIVRLAPDSVNWTVNEYKLPPPRRSAR